MTFHLASSNPLIITTAAEAQRACTYAALVVAMVRNKKKNPPSHIHSVQTERQQSYQFLLEEIEGLWVKNTENQWQLLTDVCVCVFVCARMYSHM